MQLLIDGIERNSARAGAPVIPSSHVYVLRLAALLHDTGHTVMSHVSEPLVASRADIQQLIQWTEVTYRTRKTPAASEAIAAVFVRSPAFREFVSMRQVGADFIKDTADVTLEIAGFILGGRTHPGLEYLSLLLTGAFDADKLDYMPRDCYMAGIPGAVDVERVVEKVQVLPIPTSLLPVEYRNWVGDTLAERTNVLCLSSGGANALHELATTRTMLFQKVYHHQKVRALEVMVRRTLRHLVENGTIASPRAWMELLDEELLRKEPLFDALRERDLLKRAFRIVQPQSDTEVVETTPSAYLVSGEGWIRVRDDVLNDVLRQKIVREATSIARRLQLSVDDEAVGGAEVDLPDVTRYSLDQFAFVGDGVDDFRLEGAVVAGERSENTKRLALAHGHVFAPEAAVLPVFLASRIVLLREYGQRYGDTCHTVTKLDPEQIVRAENTLLAAGHYGELVEKPHTRPARIRSHRELAVESFLKSAWSRIEALGTEFGRYQSLGTRPVSAARVAAFLRQFDTEDLARPALRLLESITLRDRAYFGRQLEQAIRDAERRLPVAYLSPAGATGDSSTLLSYLMNDIPVEYRRPVLPLELALENASRGERKGQILLWDDFCGSGGHTKTALCQWLGLPDAPLKERLVDRLSTERDDLFRKQDVAVAFSLGFTSGITELRSFAASHGLDHVTVFDPPEVIAERDSVFDGDSVIADPAERSALRDFLGNKARELLAAMRTREQDAWSEAMIENRLLGYGNTCQRLIFYYNVPTVTITALWLQTEASSWMPLFSRRKKPRAT
jgi:HD superfamily phosphohydrolase